MLNLYDHFMTRDSDEQQYVSHLVKYADPVLEVLVRSRKHRFDSNLCTLNIKMVNLISQMLLAFAC